MKLNSGSPNDSGLPNQSQEVLTMSDRLNLIGCAVDIVAGSGMIDADDEVEIAASSTTEGATLVIKGDRTLMIKSPPFKNPDTGRFGTASPIIVPTHENVPGKHYSVALPLYSTMKVLRENGFSDTSVIESLDLAMKLFGGSRRRLHDYNQDR